MQISFDLLQASDPDVYAALLGEEQRQREGLELIPSENYAFPEIYATNGSVFANKYAEGYPGRRYYGGQQFTDRIETLAVERAKQLFRAEHANVQPLSGSPMNQAVYMACLEPGDTVLAMDLSHGGHLTHGAPVSCMGRIFKFVRYKTSPPDGRIDYDAVARLARRRGRRCVLCGHSSYPRELDYARFRAIADEVGALDDGGCLARRRADRRRCARESARRRLRYRHDDDSQIAARSARRHDPLQVVARAEDRPGRVSGHAGRTAHERGRRHCGHTEARRRACVQDYAQQVLRNARALADELRRRGCDADHGRARRIT